ncbi:MAG: hypothetical protein WD426_06845 [Anditalea sp.]
MKLRCYRSIIGLCFLCACTAPYGNEEKNLPMQVAEAYGFDHMEQVESIQYTWNVQVDSAAVATRDWRWDLRSDEVYYSGPDTSLVYSLSETDTALNAIDSRFVNDKYWLLFPFQLAWDTGYEFEVIPDQTAPISGENTTKLIILYNDTDGYTPGDAYDLYLDEDNRIIEWMFRRDNGESGRAMTWENVQDYQGIKIAQDHRDKEGNKIIWFTNIGINKEDVPPWPREY